MNPHLNVSLDANFVIGVAAFLGVVIPMLMWAAREDHFFHVWDETWDYSASMRDRAAWRPWGHRCIAGRNLERRSRW